MNFVNPLDVIKVTFARFLRSSSTAAPQRLDDFEASSQSCWLSEDVPYKSETNIADDLKVLRQLEAEIYTLNDQINTVSGNNGPLLT